MGLIQDAFLEGYAAGLRREPFTNPIPAWCEGYEDAKKGHTGRLQVALWARAREEEENAMTDLVAGLKRMSAKRLEEHARIVALENDAHWVEWAERQDEYQRSRDAQRDGDER